jgi:hypothetical protein
MCKYSSLALADELGTPIASLGAGCLHFASRLPTHPWLFLPKRFNKARPPRASAEGLPNRAESHVVS